MSWSRVLKSMREKLTLGRKSVVTETPVTMTEWIHTSGPSDRSAIEENNARILKEQNGIKISKVLRTQWIRYGCSFKNDSVQDDAITITNALNVEMPHQVQWGRVINVAQIELRSQQLVILVNPAKNDKYPLIS